MSIRSSALMFVSSLALASQVRAETGAPPSAPSEIIVTASRRETTLQSTPVSVTAVGGAELQARGLTNLAAVAQATPGVSLKSEGPGQTEIELRGMTSSGGNSPTVGFYLDDIPLTAPAAAQNGKVVIDPALYDLNRVEVLRGPQGTLYGSGSMGGAVKLVPNAPDASRLRASAETLVSGTDGGGFNHNDSVMLNLPLVADTLALRLVGTEQHTSGWIDRVVGRAPDFPLVSPDGSQRGDVRDAPAARRYGGVNRLQEQGFRASLLWRPTDRLTLTPAVFHQDSRQDGISAYDSTPGAQAHYQPFDIAEPLKDDITVYSLGITYAFDGFEVSSTTADWRRRSSQVEDASEDFNNPATGATYNSNNGLPNPGYYGPLGSGPVSGRENDPSTQFSQEVRAASRGTGRLTWLAGAFYSNYQSTWNFDGRTANPSAYLDLGTFDRATTTSWFFVNTPSKLAQYALFGDVGYEVTSKLKVDVGLRYYRYDYKFRSVISGWGSGLGAATPSDSGVIRQDEDGVNPKFNVSYTASRDLMAYATVSKGFRPGGGNAQYPVTGPYWSAVYAPYAFTGGKWPTSYKSDSLWSYEVGEKARLFDRRLTVNASLYYEDWSNIQLLALPGDWALNINGNGAKIYGGEVETRTVLGGGFQLSASVSYTKATVDPGVHWQIEPRNKLSDVAPVNGDVILSYSHELPHGLTFDASWETTYVGARWSLAFPYGYSLNGRYIQLPDYSLSKLRAGVTSAQGWTATLFADNVFNKRAQLESLFQECLPSAAFNRIVTNQPLTVGLDLTFKI